MRKHQTAFGHTIHADNVNEALPLGLQLVQAYGVPVTSRGIKTIEVPGPVTTIYTTPTRRVLFDAVRDANPFFHMMDSMWMFSGTDSAALPAAFLAGITQFSDNGRTFHGAYGHRLRHPIDQLVEVVSMLRQRPDTRQAVLSIWNTARDFGKVTKDMPCNDMLMFSIRDGALDMTVCNRSNDVIWGAYGANAVQFSYIQEWVALSVGVAVGHYVQQSNSYHVYPTNPFWRAVTEDSYRPCGHVINPYELTLDEGLLGLTHAPLLFDRSSSNVFLTDCETLALIADLGINDGLFRASKNTFRSHYFQTVVHPALQAYGAYKRGEYGDALLALQDMAAEDWKVAMTDWIIRRQERATTTQKA